MRTTNDGTLLYFPFGLRRGRVLNAFYARPFGRRQSARARCVCVVRLVCPSE